MINPGNTPYKVVRMGIGDGVGKRAVDEGGSLGGRHPGLKEFPLGQRPSFHFALLHLPPSDLDD